MTRVRFPVAEFFSPALLTRYLGPILVATRFEALANFQEQNQEHSCLVEYWHVYVRSRDVKDVGQAESVRVSGEFSC